MHILHIAFFIQLPFLKNTTDVLGYDGSFAAKQFGHLRLGQPDGFAGQPDIQGRFSVLGPVHDNFAEVAG